MVRSRLNVVTGGTGLFQEGELNKELGCGAESDGFWCV